jgi:hypothetical protein
MAKKSRRVKKKGSPARLSPAQMVQPGQDEAPEIASIATRARSGPQVADLREEYRYVIADLRRIGIIAVAMVVVLVGVAFLLT